MSTTRDYGKKKLAFNEIVACYTYKRVEEQAWDPTYVKEERVLTRAEQLDDLIYSIPKDIKWKIEEDDNEGALALANHYERTVIYEYEEMRDYKLPKEALTNYKFRGPGGSFETIDYKRAIPKEKVVSPKDKINKSDKDNIKIRLVIRPNKDHYLQSAEMRTQKMNDYCLPCMLHSTSTAATIGAGDKSSRKTKGRKNREKQQLFYASGGIDM